MTFWSEFTRKFNLNTLDCDSGPSLKLKRETIQNWVKDPCGSGYSAEETLSRTYFDEIEESRYSSHPWMLDDISAFDIKDKKVLEIGFGMGTDHLAMARRGAVMHGLDMGPTNFTYTKARFQLYDKKTRLTLGDAEFLPFRDSCMDFIYSFGVVHHSPDTQKIISETYRVLKQGGHCYFAVYHKQSVFFWWSIFLAHFIIAQGWRKRSIRQQISLIEYPNTNENLVVKLYKEKQFKSLFKGFASVNSNICHLIPDDISLLRRLFKNPLKPSHFFTWLGKRFGWYVVLKAVK